MANTRVSADNGDSFPVSSDWRHDGEDITFQWVNGFDVSATFTLYGTRDADPDFSEQVQLVSSTVSSGSQDRDALSEEWNRLKIEIDATSPTSGTAEAHVHSERNLR